MIDYSKLQIEIIKNLCKSIPITNKFCYHNDKVLLTDCDNTLMVAIPRGKFIINTKGDCLCRNENKGLALLIDKETKQLYDAGYRRQGIEETEAEIKILKIQNKNLEIAFDRLEAENELLAERLKQVLLSIDTVKEMNAMCNINEQKKQAVKTFAEKLKKYTK